MTQSYDQIVKEFGDFNNYIEIKDFKTFLLLIFNLGGGQQSMMEQMGMGGGNSRVTLPYDEDKGVYFSKIYAGMTTSQPIIIYCKRDKFSEDGKHQLIHKSNSNIFKDIFNKDELKRLKSNKTTLLTPSIIDYQEKTMKPKKIVVGIDTYFKDLAEFIISHELKYIFMVESEAMNADILFALNIPMLSNECSNDKEMEHIQYFDVFVDTEKQISKNDVHYIQLKKEEIDDNNLKLHFLSEIKELGHADAFNSSYTLIVPVNSFKKV